MGMCRDVFIEQKLFSFRKENDRWWSITESSRRVVKYVSLDQEALGWLGFTVKECATPLVSSDFLRTHRKGNSVLMVQRGCNHNGSFFSLSEFGHDKRRGMIVVSEGRKGEGWRIFEDTIKELTLSSSVWSGRNRGACVLVPSQAGKMKGHKGGGDAPSSMALGSRSYREVVQNILPHVVVPDTSSTEIVRRKKGDGSELLGLNEDILLRSLAEMEEKIGFLLEDIFSLKRCVKGKEVMKMGLGQVGKAHHAQAGVVMGPGPGQQRSGPKKAWVSRVQNEISAQTTCIPPTAPIRIVPDSPPAHKLSPNTVDYHSEFVQALHSGTEVGKLVDTVQIVCSPATLIWVSPDSTLTQKFSLDNVDHHGESVNTCSVIGESVEVSAKDGSSYVDLSSLSPGVLKTQSQSHGVGEGTDALLVLSNMSEHEVSLQGHEVSLSPGVLKRQSQSQEVGEGFDALLVLSNMSEHAPVVNQLILAESRGEPILTCSSDLALFSSDSIGEEGASLTPLCTLPPSSKYGSCPSNWVFKKVEEIQAVIGISFGGYEEQFKALLIALEASHSKSASKQDRELRRLTCSINYDAKEGSGGRDRLKGRGNLGFL
ncbi:hypothetical protein F2P56_029600 [Juglans regia]|uniref:Uncharacterized protein n=1 Tax=Juglans regia TaxID=51240 RepID=A0A833TJ98_JUGRE|nr:hypothetical protein F2P56_029600 [Juglans regia]